MQIEVLQKELQKTQAERQALLAAQQQAAQQLPVPVQSRDLQAFYTATQPLNIWLDHCNFKYVVASYQREYEWDKVQVIA